MNAYKLIVSIFILFGISRFLLAQPYTKWIKCYESGDVGKSVKQTTDGGYIVAGSVYNYYDGFRNKEDGWLLRTDSEGNVLWKKTYGEAEYDDVCNSVCQTSDGGFIMTGFTASFSKGAEQDLWLIKTDAAGDTIWTKHYGGSLSDGGTSVQQISDDRYIVTGYLQIPSSDTPYYYLWLIKVDSYGDIVWTKTYGDDNQNSMGRSIQKTDDNGYIITGQMNRGVCLIKTDSLGDSLWTKIFPGEQGRSVIQTSDGSYILTGNTRYTNKYDLLLIKTNMLGDTLWTRKYQGEDLTDNVGYSVSPTIDGGYIVAGYTAPIYQNRNDPRAWILKTDFMGDTLWTQTYLDIGAVYGYAMDKTKEGEFIITGYFRHPNYPDSNKLGAYLLKIGLKATKVQNDNNNDVFQYQLFRNYPNPFNPLTTIKFQIPNPEYVSLKIFNILGKEVTTLISKKLSPGIHTYHFDGSNFASGVYYYYLMAGEFREVKKMILIK
jgi:hypothetical protein